MHFGIPVISMTFQLGGRKFGSFWMLHIVMSHLRVAIEAEWNCII
jgi:hypothetical protein